MTLVEVASDMAIVVACDPSVSLPSGTDQDALLRELEPLARTGKVFYLVTDDPVRYRIRLLLDELPQPGLDRMFEPAGGTFGLELPSGHLALHGWRPDGAVVVAGSIQSKPGAHVLTVLARRPFEYPGHAAEMRELIGSDWDHVQRVNKLGVVGCLPLVLTATAILARKWHWLWFILPLLALSWLPYLLLRASRRYKAAERKESEVERARPHYVFRVIPTEHHVLPGGFLRVP